MESSSTTSAKCPFQADRDDRKSAAIAAQNVKPEKGARIVRNVAFARDVLRSPDMRQGGAGAELIKLDNPEHVSVFFLDGDLHRRRRTVIARYFMPKAITQRYHQVMHRTADYLMADLKAKGTAVLDELSFQMAVDVASEVIGLTNSDNRALARRLKTILENSMKRRTTITGRAIGMLLIAIGAERFYRKDMKPAVQARKTQPREDVISYMVQEGYSKKAMIIECLTYGSAGMLTTREFIVMAAWHLLENHALQQRFLEGSEEDQFAILDEIIRLEPVAGMVHRRAAADIAETSGGPIKMGELFAMDIRALNTDEEFTGPCPLTLDPDRSKQTKGVFKYMSFGDGPHRCPGFQVALHETRIFLDKLLRMPGIRLVSEPKLQWNSGLMSYEVRNAVVVCQA